MKALLQHIFSLFFGLYFLLAGTGFNIVNYCCNSCEDEGIENIALHSCDAVHQHESDCCDDIENHQTDNQDMACESPTHHPDNCHILRLKVEIPALTSAVELKSIEIFDFNLFACTLNHSFDTVSPLKTTNTNLPPPDEILYLAGREILSSKSVLII